MLMSKFDELSAKLFEMNPFIPIGIVSVLAVIFLFLVFVSPGLTFGIDLEGGNLMVLQSDKVVNASELESFLSAEFSLKDLKVSTTSSSLLIQFSQEENIAQAEKMFKQAKTSGDKQLFLNSLNPIKSFIKQEETPND